MSISNYFWGMVGCVNVEQDIFVPSVRQDSKVAITEDAITEDAIAEVSIAEVSIAEVSITEDAITEDAITEDAIAEVSIAEVSIAEVSITEDAITEDAIAEVVIAVEDEIPPFRDVEDIDPSIIEESIFLDNEFKIIKPLMNMTRCDYRLVSQYETLQEKLLTCKDKLEELNEQIYQARKILAQEEKLVLSCHGMIPCYSNYVDRIHDEIENVLPPNYNKEMYIRMLEKHRKQHMNYYNKNKKIGMKIIKHFKEKRFIEICQKRDRVTREYIPIPSKTIDLDKLESSLPEEIVELIGSFLPISIRIHLLENKYQFHSKVNTLSSRKSSMYWNYLSRSDNYSAINIDDFLADNIYLQIYGSWLGNVYYRKTMKERQRSILFLYYKNRTYNEPEALKMLKEFAILFGRSARDN